MSSIAGGRAHSADSSQNPEEAFLRLSQLFCAHLAREGLEVLGYRSRNLPLFSKLSPDGKRKVVSDLEGTLLIFDEMSAAGESLRDSARLLWRSLLKIGLTPCSNAFEGISDGDIVEVYGLDFVQMFRNVEFFRMVSMTLEEMSCLTWAELIHTEDTQVFSYYQKVIEKVHSGVLSQGYSPENLAYDAQEKLGDRRRFRITMKWLAPVSQSGRPYAVIAVNRTKIIA